MKRYKKQIALILTALLIWTSVLPQIGIAYAEQQSESAEDTIEIEIPAKKEETQILVKYKEGTLKDELKDKAIKDLNLTRLTSLKFYKGSEIELLEIEKTDDIALLKSYLEASGKVEFVEINQSFKTEFEPSDEGFIEEWGLNNIGQSIQNSLGTEGIDINVKSAWDTTLGSESVVVGILDTGIDIQHRDLKANIYVNTGEIADNGVDDDGNGYIDDISGYDFANDDATVYDSAAYDSHGTHLAGIIAASQNDVGIVGVAPNVKIMPLKFIENGAGYISDALDSIEYAKMQGIKIINCSFGTYYNSPSLKAVMANTEILFICAAGNDGANTTGTSVYPAAYDLPNTISVGAIDNKGRLSKQSNYGRSVEIAAPGEGIFSTWPNNAYSNQSGTSIATAFVSGVAALLESEYPDISVSEMKSRILASARPLEDLRGLVQTGGIVNAKNAISKNTEVMVETDESIRKNVITEPIDQTLVIPMAASVSAKVLDEIHFGEDGVNVGTGNYSKTLTDFKIFSPGFQINIARTYNSKDDRTGSYLGRGWTFGFKGELIYDSTNSLWMVQLPNGKVEAFVKNANGTYTANDSRDKLTKNSDNTHTLTTPDQYKYAFDKNNNLYQMTDRNGNSITMHFSAEGRLTDITDQAGRMFIFEYQGEHISNVYFKENSTAESKRVVQYHYDTAGKLSEVVSANLEVIERYTYDTNGLLKSILNGDQVILESFEYNAAKEVTKHTTSDSNVETYTYDNANRKTTITDSNGRSLTKIYDESKYVISSTDGVGTASCTYYLDTTGKNKYGEIKAVTDRYGRTTHYERDTNGNITKTINPDGSYSEYFYDSKNNEIKEIDEDGRKSFFIYDNKKINLIKEVRPLDGIKEYDAQADQSQYAIINYDYYTDAELANMGSLAKGLLKSKIDESGFRTLYEYDKYGYQKKETDHEGRSITTTYSPEGWLIYKRTPQGIEARYDFDKIGNLLRKEIFVQGQSREVQRNVYDKYNRLIQEISPEIYESAFDNRTTNVYSDSTKGTRYAYDKAGNLISITDKAGNLTSYTYTPYGEVKSTTHPNTLVENWTYDKIGRVISKSTNAPASGVIEYAYSGSETGEEIVTEKVKLTETETAVTKTTYDFRGNVTQIEKPDLTLEINTYTLSGLLYTQKLANGATNHYHYDGMGRLSDVYYQVEGNDFRYKGYKYYGNGDTKAEISSKKLVALGAIPDKTDLIETRYQYFMPNLPNIIIKPNGQQTIITYNEENNAVKRTTQLNETDSEVIIMTYDYKGRTLSESKQIDEKTAAVQTYKYDLAGRVIETKSPLGKVSKMYYDLNGNLTLTENQIINYSGSRDSVIQSFKYDNMDRLIEKTDALGGKTSYTYNTLGQLTKEINAIGGITTYEYDLAGRKIAAEYPKSNAETDPQKKAKTLYYLDVMGRTIAKEELYEGKVKGTGHITVAFAYNEMGEQIKSVTGNAYLIAPGSTMTQKIDNAIGTEYSYDLDGKLIRETAPEQVGLGFTKKHLYDGLGREIMTVDGNKGVITKTYDNMGSVTSKGYKKSPEDREIKTATYKYDIAGRLLEATDAYGYTVSYEYGMFKTPEKINYPQDQGVDAYWEANTYDLEGKLMEKVTSLGQKLSYEYDDLSNLKKQTESDEKEGQRITVSKVYDTLGRIISETDANKNTTIYTYDAIGQTLTETHSVTNVDGGKTQKITQYAYDLNGKLIGVTNWQGLKQRFTYDGINRLTSRTDFMGNIVERMTYDASSQQIEAYDGKGGKTTYEYDKNGQLIKTTDSENRVTQSVYDANGNTIRTIDGKEQINTYAYDTFGRLITVTDPLGGITRYTYDLNGNRLTQTDANGNIKSYVYNGRGLQTSFNDGLNAETYQYRGDGKLKRKVDRKGQEQTFEYDIHSRLIKDSTSDETITYEYDGNGNKTKMTDGTGSTVRVYDEENRVILKSLSGIGTTSYWYDLPGSTVGESVERSRDLTGSETEKTYDGNNRLIKVKAGSSGETTYTYDANGNQNSVTYPHGKVSTYTFNNVNEIMSLVTTQSGSVLESYSYTYDANGNQESKTDAKGTTTYKYDANNQLIYVNEPMREIKNNGVVSKVLQSVITEYNYDKVGNRILERVTSTEGGITTKEEKQYTYDAQNRLKSIIMQKGTDKETTAYSYDQNGNMIAKTFEKIRRIDPVNPPIEGFGTFIIGQENKDPRLEELVMGTVKYEYDARDRLTVAKTGEGSEENRYNGENQRVEKLSGDEVTRYVYEGSKVTLELDEKYKLKSRNIYGNKLILRQNGTDLLYYLYNGHGDVTGLFDQTGTLTASYYYDAFGNVLESNTKTDNPFLYSGYRHDKETGLYYLNARYYDPYIGRFITEDVYPERVRDPLSLNRYTYCLNQPIKYVDPTGYREAVDTLGKVTDSSSNWRRAAQARARKAATTKAEKAARARSVENAKNQSKKALRDASEAMAKVNGTSATQKNDNRSSYVPSGSSSVSGSVSAGNAPKPSGGDTAASDSSSVKTNKDLDQSNIAKSNKQEKKERDRDRDNDNQVRTVVANATKSDASASTVSDTYVDPLISMIHNINAIDYDAAIRAQNGGNNPTMNLVQTNVNTPLENEVVKGDVETEDVEGKKNGVVGIGLSTSAHLMGGGSSGKTVYFDRNGNVAIMQSTSLTATTDVEISGGITVEASFNANDVRQMNGRSVVIGVGGDLPGISPGGNYEYSISEGTGEVTSHSLGVNMNMGISPAEIHGGMSENEMLTRFNYKDLEGERRGSMFGLNYSIEFDFKNWEFSIK